MVSGPYLGFSRGTSLGMLPPRVALASAVVAHDETRVVAMSAVCSIFWEGTEARTLQAECARTLVNSSKVRLTVLMEWYPIEML